MIDKEDPPDIMRILSVYGISSQHLTKFHPLLIRPRLISKYTASYASFLRIASGAPGAVHSIEYNSTLSASDSVSLQKPPEILPIPAFFRSFSERNPGSVALPNSVTGFIQRPDLRRPSMIHTLKISSIYTSEKTIRKGNLK